MSTVRCGNRRAHGAAGAHHETVAQVRLCFAREGGVRSLEDRADEDSARGDWDADRAYERHLETNEAYRWESEQDELRAQWGLPG